MDDQEKESSLKPISEGVQEILEDQTAELKALGIYASFQPVNLGKGGEDNVNLDTLYYHTGMFSDALLDKLKMEFPNEKLKDEFKECVLFDIHSSITTEQGALVTPYEAYIAQNYTNDMEELLRLSREAEKCLSDLAWDACNDVLDSIYRLQQEYKEDRQRPSYQIDMVTEVFNEHAEVMKSMSKKQPTRGQTLAKAIIGEYKPKTVEDMQNALKDVFGPMFEAMLNGEMENHLGYDNNERGEKATDNRRNGYLHKTIKTSAGEVPIDVPRDRDGSFEPQVVQKRQKDVSSIEGKVLAMYARGMSQRDISATIDDIYGFKLSAGQISNITDCVLDELNEWQNRPLKAFYPFIFVDCIYVSMRTEKGVSDQPVYVVLGYDLKGEKDVLGLWMGDTESKHRWMQVFDEIKSRGVQDIGFISMDGVSGLEDGAKSIFKTVVVQRCIVHLVRNSLKYVPSKDYKAFTAQLKKIYGAINLKAAQAEFERFCDDWSKYPGAVRVWKTNFRHIEQLFNYGSDVRRVMYTTNAIESVNSSFRKVTKKGAFSSETAVFKVFYLRIKELYQKWQGHAIRNWAMVMNQLIIDERIGAMVQKYQASI